MPPELPTDLPTPPLAVEHRLLLQALPVRSVWFPSRNDLRDWDHSGSPVYVRRLSPGRFEIGPRLGAMWASVFSPIIVAELEAAGPGTRAVWRRGYPRLTTAVLGIWAVLIAIWGTAIGMGIGTNGVLGWLLITFVTVVAPIVGGTRGGRALDAAIPWITEVVLAPDESEDW